MFQREVKRNDGIFGNGVYCTRTPVTQEIWLPWPWAHIVSFEDQILIWIISCCNREFARLARFGLIKIEITDRFAGIRRFLCFAHRLLNFFSSKSDAFFCASTDWRKMESRRLSCSFMARAASSMSLNILGLTAAVWAINTLSFRVHLQHRAAARAGDLEGCRLFSHATMIPQPDQGFSFMGRILKKYSSSHPRSATETTTTMIARDSPKTKAERSGSNFRATNPKIFSVATRN